MILVHELPVLETQCSSGASLLIFSCDNVFQVVPDLGRPIPCVPLKQMWPKCIVPPEVARFLSATLLSKPAWLVMKDAPLLLRTDFPHSHPLDQPWGLELWMSIMR
jgi:hypothetical protein